MNRELRGNYPRIARGEYPVYIPFTLPDILDLKGLPVKAIMPERGLALRALRRRHLQGRAAPECRPGCSSTSS